MISNKNILPIKVLVSKTLRKFCTETKKHKNSYSNRFDITLIPGNNIGPFVTKSLIDIFECADAPINFQTINNFDWNNIFDRIKLRSNPNVFVGNILGTRGDYYLENTIMYQYLCLDVKISQHCMMPNIKTRFKEVEYTIVRANQVSRNYSIDQEVSQNVYQNIKLYYFDDCLRVAKRAFEFAENNKIDKVCYVKNKELNRDVDRLMYEACEHISALYPKIHVEEKNQKNATIDLVLNPERTQGVLIMPKVSGVIFSAIGAGLIGSENIVAGSNYGLEYSLYEQGMRTQDGLFQRSTGERNINPTALILSGINMLNDLGEYNCARLIKIALLNSYKMGNNYMPCNVGGVNDCEMFTKIIINNMEKLKSKSSAALYQEEIYTDI